MDLFDTWDIFRRNDDGLTNVLVRYDTTQIDNAVPDDRIDPDRRPVVILDGRKDAITEELSTTTARDTTC